MHRRRIITYTVHRPGTGHAPAPVIYLVRAGTRFLTLPLLLPLPPGAVPAPLRLAATSARNLLIAEYRTWRTNAARRVFLRTPLAIEQNKRERECERVVDRRTYKFIWLGCTSFVSLSRTEYRETGAKTFLITDHLLSASRQIQIYKFERRFYFEYIYIYKLWINLMYLHFMWIKEIARDFKKVHFCETKPQSTLGFMKKCYISKIKNNTCTYIYM